MTVESGVQEGPEVADPGASTAAGATLLLGVERAGRPLLGNVVIAVEQLDGGATRRGLRFHRTKRRYVYRDMPLGAHEIRVTIPRYEPLVRHIELRHPGTVEIVLEPVPLKARPALTIDVGTEMRSMTEFVCELGRDPAALTRF